jgi:dihydrofolate reductase
MGRLFVTAITSLDLYVADREGKWDWATPDEEVHRFVNELERPVGTYLLGRRMYEVMRFWEEPAATDDQPDVMRDYARMWRAADKVVYSKTLHEVAGTRTRIERSFDIDAVRELKDSAGSDISIGGAELAAHAVRAGLVDEYRLLLYPVIVGAGKRALPDDVFVRLDLIEHSRVGRGVVFLRYRGDRLAAAEQR